MSNVIQTDVCIVGSGPAGSTLALMLAKQGIKVTLLERNTSFQREFRGESISSGSVEILEELGVLEKLRPDGYINIEGMMMYGEGKRIFEMDYRRFKTLSIDLPQPSLMQALIDLASVYPNFSMMSGANCSKLIEEEGKVVGVIVKQGTETFEIRSSVVVAGDGRYSLMRKLAGLEANISTFDRDLIWFRLPRPDDWGTVIRIKALENKHLIILPTYPNLLRIGYNIPKGGFRDVKARGLQHFYEDVCLMEPAFDGIVQKHVTSWEDTVLLDIFSAYAEKWSRDGFVLIGDSAHTFSPVLGQGVNLAIQDSYELAPLLVEHFQKHGNQTVPDETLRKLQEIRKTDTAFIQRFQGQQERMLSLKGPLRAFARRSFYRVLNAIPLKYKVMKRIAFGVRG
ncbi:FAD-dependent oxidoreductase [Brevibacillus dissolubilis]|uniref:FAD-dependent oxidoreductase n=1 Tax=Brevibacillus dissolubilis TaxID=1844116 RepID=UPI0011173C76|nr:FAD-dependent oxidoreductase [Brevibacillus dissolubilis]